jgi:hypothetical protein
MDYLHEELVMPATGKNWEARIGRRIKLRDLHVLLTVVQRGSMAKAAQQLSVTQPAVSKSIAELEHASAGARNRAQVIPAGIAFVRAMQEHPGIDLYQSDKSHPSLAGTYLAACTALVTLTGKSPRGLSYSGGLDPEAALALQQVAWDSVISFIQPVRGVESKRR